MEAIYESLLPRSLDDRLRFYVIETPWGFLRRGKTEGDEEQPVRELAEECARRPEFVLTQLPALLIGSQRNFYPFGRRLGEVYPDPKRFIASALDFLGSSDSADVSSSLLGAFLAGLEERQPDLVQQTLDTAAARPRLHRYLVDLTRFVTAR
jgi:hypothetical protein